MHNTSHWRISRACPESGLDYCHKCLNLDQSFGRVRIKNQKTPRMLPVIAFRPPLPLIPTFSEGGESAAWLAHHRSVRHVIRRRLDRTRGLHTIVPRTFDGVLHLPAFAGSRSSIPICAKVREHESGDRERKLVYPASRQA